MATTTNYGWDTPDDTDLVKDGAAAIRTLGSSVDTTTKALNPSTTLGDVEYRSATANTNTRLGIGTTGQVLTVTGGVPAWETISAGGITLISTTTMSGSTTTLSSIPSTYKHLQVIIKNIDPTDDADYCDMRLNSDSTANRHRTLTNFTGGASQLPNSTSIQILAEIDNVVNTAGFSIINIYDYANTTTWKYGDFMSSSNNFSDVTYFNMKAGYFVYNQISAISSLQFISTFNTWAGGTIELYGVQ
jgi:hypothetical protein